MVEVPVKLYLPNILKQCKNTVRQTAAITTAVKDKFLSLLADRIEDQAEGILKANEQDVLQVGKTLEGEPNKDRIKEAVSRVRLDGDDIKWMADSLRRIADFPDPVGEVVAMSQRPNGMQVSRVRAPIGVVGIISESSPRILVESVGLCVKSGNVVVYRGSPEWTQTSARVAALIRESAEQTGVPANSITMIPRFEKEVVLEMFRQPKLIDVLVVKGGAGLRRVAMEQSRVPLLCHDGGINVLYIDAEADLPLAQNLVINAKVQDIAAPNALDTLLVHQNTARLLLPALVRRLLDEFKIEVRGCPKTTSLIGSQSFSSYKSLKEANDDDWGQQWLSDHIAVKVVTELDEALGHIAQYGPALTAAVVTRNYGTAMRFGREVDAAAVLINASTRLHDGEEFGLGPAAGTSSGRTHARGPIGLMQLTCEKYVVLGTGQLRHPHPVPMTYEDAIMLKRPS